MTTRVRCPHCGQQPKTLRDGRMRKHNIPWPQKLYGHPCPGSRTIPNQPQLEEPRNVE